MKFLYWVFGIAVLAAGALGGYYFFTVNQKPSLPKSGPATQSSQVGSVNLIEVKGPLAIAGYLNLFDITKAQVENWAKVQGPVSVPTYPGPIPTLPPELSATLSAQIGGPKPTTVGVIAGYFRGAKANTIVINQAGTDINLVFGSGASLWIKSGEKVQIASSPLADLLASGKLSQYVDVNSLVLVPNVKDISKELKSSPLVVFK